MSFIKLVYLLLFILIVNCSGNKISNYHGVKSLDSKYDQLKINNERDWTLKISSAVEESYKYRFFQNNIDSVNSILSLTRAKQIANNIENNQTEVAFKSNSYEFDVADIAQGHTAHLTTSDKYGNVVSLTQTLGPNMGSRVATKGLGFLYNVTILILIWSD